MPKRLTGIEQLAPIDSANLHQQVYSQLRQAIMSGKFRPGEALTLRGLAAALKTSIMPARDAVLRLVVEHALESSGRGVRVPTLDISRLEDVCRFRIALEGEAAALAAERATAAEIIKIEQCGGRVIKARASNHRSRFLAANQEFHFAVYRAAHSDLLQSMIETLWLQIGPHLALLTDTEQSDQTEIDLSAHDDLIAALKARDSKAARAAIESDLKDSTDIYRPYVQQAEVAPAKVRKRA